MGIYTKDLSQTIISAGRNEKKTFTLAAGTYYLKTSAPPQQYGRYRFTLSREHAHVAGDWVITKRNTCTTAGSKEVRCTGCNALLGSEVIPAKGHKYGSWITTKKATVFATGSKYKTCSACSNRITASIAKLKPTIKLSATNITLKKGKKKTITISMLANGDSVYSVKSNNSSLASVKKIKKNTYQITAKKKGKATITVTLKSKLKKKITVSVK